MQGRYLSHEANEWEATYRREKNLYFQRWKPGADLGIGRVQFQQELRHLDKPHPFKDWLMGRPNYYIVVPDDQLDGYTPSEEDPDADAACALLRAEFLAYRWIVPNVTEQRGSTRVIPYDYFNHYMDAQRGIAQMCFPEVEKLTEAEAKESSLPESLRLQALAERLRDVPPEDQWRSIAPRQIALARIEKREEKEREENNPFAVFDRL